MRKDDHLIFEALVGMNSTQDYAQPTDDAGKPRPRTKEEIRARFNDAMARSMASRNGENAEHEPHGYPQGITAIQNVLINQLKKHGFTLTKISHVDKERDKYPTVFMMRSRGPMHNVVEIDGMGMINGEPYADYLNNLKAYAQDDADVMLKNDDPGRIQDGAEDAESYSAMTHLTQAANEIRDILTSHADDEARTEHIIKMAQMILGSPEDYAPAEYRKMLDGLIVLLNRFIVVPMN